MVCKHWSLMCMHIVTLRDCSLVILDRNGKPEDPTLIHHSKFRYCRSTKLDSVIRPASDTRGQWPMFKYCRFRKRLKRPMPDNNININSYFREGDRRGVVGERERENRRRGNNYHYQSLHTSARYSKSLIP